MQPGLDLSTLTESVVINDNEKAKAILASLGMLEPLLKRRPAEPYACWIGGADNERHAFVFGMRFSGFENQADNGYTVVLFPERNFTSSQAVAAFHGFAKQFFDSNAEFAASRATT